MSLPVTGPGKRFGFDKSLASVAIVALFLLASYPIHAQTQAVLYSFNFNSGDGYSPADNPNLVMDKDGNFYGTTVSGGSHNLGTVFKVTPDGAETLLHSFGASTDGTNPSSSLIMDSSGNLYGTTEHGGASGGGTVFKLTPTGKELHYSFCVETGCPDGEYPAAALVMDKAGNVYGTTTAGGAHNSGTVFKINRSGNESVLYSFGATSTDGSTPSAALIMDSKGNFYGTTVNGGANNNSNCGVGCGTVFKVTNSGAETVLYSFGASSTDGTKPSSSLIMDSRGNLYGTTQAGGTNVGCSPRNPIGCGTAFKLTSGGTETVLYNFCTQSGCSDGAVPASGLTMDASGKFYGTTSQGGANSNSICNQGSLGIGCGTVFSLTLDGTEIVLYNFCSQVGCNDGATPSSGLITDSKGNFYGTTAAGGVNGFGTYGGAVFELTP